MDYPYDTGRLKNVIREVAAQFENPALLFSGGKDSITVAHLAKKAVWVFAITWDMEVWRKPRVTKLTAKPGQLLKQAKTKKKHKNV